MRKRLRIFWAFSFGAVVLIAAANTSESHAGVRGDLRAGFFTNGSNGSLGAGIIGGIAPNLYVNPMIEYVFVGGAVTAKSIEDEVHSWRGGSVGWLQPLNSLAFAPSLAYLFGTYIGA